jgi:hypothetical protein
MQEQELRTFCILFNRWRKRLTSKQKLNIDCCSEWQPWPDGFIAFATWSLANGFSPELVCDRIDGTKGYSPENCQWITQQKNVEKSRSSKSVEYQGTSYPSLASCWKAKAIPGLSLFAFRARLLSGWPIHDALTLTSTHGNTWRNR